jgi:hypothetical protein
MSKTKLTPWFTGDVKPVRPGVYQRRGVNGRVYYSRWPGDNWLFGLWYTPSDASHLFLHRASMHQALPWRGIAAEVK